MKKILSIFKTLFVIMFIFIITGCSNNNQEVTADKYIVKFDTNGGSVIEDIEVKPGEYIKKPADPEKEGYTFIEWQLRGKRFNFNSQIKENITLKAKWEITGTGDQEVNEYTVFFDSNGGSKVDNIKVKSGTKVNKPKDPTRSGYTFVEWQHNGKTYDFEDAVNENIELIAKWNKNEEPKPSPSPSVAPSPSPSASPSPSPSVAPTPSPSTSPSPSPSPSASPKPSLPDPDPIAQARIVRFDTNGGTAIEDVVVKEGLPVTRPVNPTKDGYNFKEWQLNGTPFDFNTKIYENITLTAIWVQKDFKVKVETVEDAIENRKLTVYQDGVEITVKEIKLTDGTLLCSGDTPVVLETAITGVTEFIIVLNSGNTVNATLQQ